ncbi:short-chain dehydrogenase [Rhodococcus sp. 06-621-2]|nr:SDR family NAD(P)-dependent oxidoreductase [Rhodococcus sp. 06-621-2]OZC55539.1 short-chain dehydrogenase [Rhodococcus sp. 06-621-2]
MNDVNASIDHLRRDDGLDGRVAVITGAASGIGRALASAYARAGTNVVLGYYSGDAHDVNKVVSEVEAIGGKAIAVDVDVRDSSSVDSLFDTAVNHFGRLDIAVAGAANIHRSAIGDMTDETWHGLLDIDLTGVMRTVRAATQTMSGPGAIVAVSSFLGPVVGWNDNSHYAAAKAGVLGMVRSLAVELAPRQIRVNALIPGLIRTPQTLDPVNSLGSDGLDGAGGSIIPWGRVGTADEAARAIRFLTSDDSSFVTGQQIVVDGGMTVRWAW